MKKLLKKIGVLGLIIALFAPFIELPTVNAAEGCTNHLQNYLWLDMNYFNAGTGTGKTFMEGYAQDAVSERGVKIGGYLTYTNFPYAFKSEDNYDIKIRSVDNNNLMDTDSYNSYWTAFSKITASLATDELDPKIGGTLVTEHKLNNYVDDTILLHGVWARYGSEGKPEESNWKKNIKDGDKNSLQKVIKDIKEKKPEKASEADNLLKAMTIKFSAADFDNNIFYHEKISSLIEYFQKNVDEGYNVWGEGYIPLQIIRTLNLDTTDIKDLLNNFVFGEKSGNSWVAFSTKSGEVKDSYSALIATTRETVTVNEKDIDFDISKPYYWPAVLSVEYEACPKEKKEWTLEYNGNVDGNSVTNVPNSQNAKVGESIVVDSKIPLREGYTFKEWCENSNGSGKCYSAGEKITSNEVKTIPLFAQWGKGGTEDNKKTGVMSYVIGFISVGIIAGGIYLVAKKKNLFKQI